MATHRFFIEPSFHRSAGGGGGAVAALLRDVRWRLPLDAAVRRCTCMKMPAKPLERETDFT
jgi:hypothetical protein